jgi:RNA polymerase sigma-70 factor (ECF subfamily)
MSMTDTYCIDLAAKTRGLIPAHLRRLVDPDDVAQEVYRRVCADPGRFSGRDEAEVRAYLCRTLRSVIKDAVRRFDRLKREASRERSLGAAAGGSVGSPERWLAADHTSPSKKASRNEQLARLAEALAALPADQRRAVELHHLDGQSLEQTAAAMRKSKQAVAGLLRRGLQAMRERLDDRAG